MKQLTVSQQQHFLLLLERQRAAAATIAHFLDYLRDEHAAPAHEGWALRDIQRGFEKEKQEDGPVS